MVTLWSDRQNSPSSGCAAGIRCLDSSFPRQKIERSKHLFEVDQHCISASSIVVPIVSVTTPQNLIRSLRINIQNGGLALIAEVSAKLSFNFHYLSSVPVHVGSSGDQSVLLPVLRSVCVAVRPIKATQSKTCAATILIDRAQVFWRRSCPM